jgi:hypothetical protein
MDQLSTVVDRVVSAENSGGHVNGSARNGQILDFAIDPQWADTARNSELEGEITDLLRKPCRASTPADLASGPQSSAITELNALVSNPDAGVGVSLGLVTAAVIAMQSYVQVITGEQANITQKIHDDLGDWANSNIDALGHASVNDPDGTNWHVNS